MQRVIQAIKQAKSEDLLKGIATFHEWFHTINSSMQLKMIAGLNGINANFWNKYQQMVHLATDELNMRQKIADNATKG